MIRKFTLLVLGLVLSLSLKAQDWRDELLAKNAGVIDSVVQLIDPAYFMEDYSSYMVYYHQPIDHDAPEAGSLPLRALLMVSHKNNDISNRVVQMSIGGYELDTVIVNHPNIWADEFSYTLNTGEVSGAYYGHFIMPEHRFYGKSLPDNFTTHMSHCNAKEAAADFHALAEAMKKVFKGKWAITGVSKGGVATAIQHAYYPEDADIFVPYVSPINNGANDLRQQEYWLTKSWTPELREHAMHIQKKILDNPKIYEYYYNYLVYFVLPGYEIQDQINFLNKTVCKLDEDAHQNIDRSEIEKIFRNNQKIMQKHGLSDYDDAMLMCMLQTNSYAIDDNDYEEWVELINGNENSQSTRAKEMPSFLSDDEIYAYQSITELGYFDLKWDYYYDSQAKIDSITNLWRGFLPNLAVLGINPALWSLEFDPSLMNFIKQQTAQAKKPILFIYGEDDPWTGACIDDEYVNGTNVRKYILPAQCHTASIHDIKDSDRALKDELNDFIRAALFPSPDGISEVNDEPAAAPAGIVFDQQNRRIVIRRNGQEYDVMGKKVF